MFFCCAPSHNALLNISNQRFKILRLLGEGGFSYVYLVSSRSGERFALKKIRCAFGAESVRAAMRELSAYKEFNLPYVIRTVDSSVVSESDGLTLVYVLLPYYSRGTLQDKLTELVIRGEHLPETEVLRIFIGICKGLQAMHRHKKPAEPIESRDAVSAADTDFLLGDEDDSTYALETIDTESEYTAYAHRDLKPANVMLSDDGVPVLCDLGSCCKARVTVETRQEALKLQDEAAEHSTLPYRAPELLDVVTGAKIDERTDIWLLGCVLYALMYGSSPFERAEAESGASVSLAISTGKYQFPEEGEYLEKLRNLVKMCLVVDPAERPPIEKVMRAAIEIS